MLADLTCLLVVNNYSVDFDSCNALKSFAGPINQEKLASLLTLIDCLEVCCGQPDEHLVKMVVTNKKGKILSPDGKLAAFVDNKMVLFIIRQFVHPTVKYLACLPCAQNVLYTGIT